MSSGLESALTGLSSSCQSALPSLLTSSFASCAQVVNLVSIATSSSESIVTPITNYIDSLCTTTPCSQSDLDTASNIVTSGCSSDIQSGSAIPVALDDLIKNFGGVRSLLCTKQTSNNTYCVPEIISAAQNATGSPITLSSLSSLVSGGSTSAATTFLDSIPKSVYCNDCGSAIVSEAEKIAQNISSDAASQLKSAAQQQCGSTTFGDGTLPEGISTAGSSGVSSSSSSSSSSSGTGAAGRGVNLSGKTLTIIGTISAAVLGASMVIA